MQAFHIETPRFFSPENALPASNLQLECKESFHDSLQAQTLLPIQRAPAGCHGHLRHPPPAVKLPEERVLSPIDVQSLLSPIEEDRHIETQRSSHPESALPASYTQLNNIDNRTHAFLHLAPTGGSLKARFSTRH